MTQTTNRMTFTERDERLSELVSRRVEGTLVTWRLIAEHFCEDEFIVMWRKPLVDGRDQVEFGVHRALLGVDGGPCEGSSDLHTGDYTTNFDFAVKQFKQR